MCCAFYSELVKGFKERAIIGPCVELIAKRTILKTPSEFVNLGHRALLRVQKSFKARHSGERCKKTKT